MKAGMRRARASWCECSAAKKGKRTLVVARGSQHPTEETNKRTNFLLAAGHATQPGYSSRLIAAPNRP